MGKHDVSLGDKYDLGKDRIFVSGTQALVRLVLMQKELDRRKGLNTAGYVTGYRGSPLGGLDQQFSRARNVLAPADILFQPGLNEDLAATALWGAQQAEMRGEGKFDGVFGIWYGKGPGVDRTGDVFRHSNFAGSSKNGGVLALMGDDHTCESSTTAHQSEFAFVDAMIPVLNPAGVQEILDYGLYGYALSRYAGVWAALKCIKDTVESTASIDGALDRVSFNIPDDFEMPEGGLNIRPNDHPIDQEARLHDYKRDAIQAFLRANPINHVIWRGGSKPSIGIASLGKSYLDTLQALADLGIDEVKAADLGIRLYKIGCPWPLEPRGVKAFAEGLDKIIVVEEKRSLVESQIKEQLYGTNNGPVVVGKRDENERVLFPAKGALDSNDIAIAIGERVLQVANDPQIAERVAALKAFQKTLADTDNVATRIPYFCAGCPHNTSTHVPDGSRAYAGIGCSYMVQWMDRATEGFTHMGGEGANWIGESPFSTRGHVFQNLGDGTYNHSGYMAIRAAKASGVNITYKILYNDAVAMTGGQPHEGGLTVPDIAAQVAAEGAKPVIIVSDEPQKYPSGVHWPEGTQIRHRDDLDEIQKMLREEQGLSVMIYDQTCATEKRRRRKRGTFPDPDKRVVVNELVCEGCGDCGVKSNCVAIVPVETEFGRKRQIDQSTCNKDFSCLKGFCPSFVSVSGAKIKKASPKTLDGIDVSSVPEPQQASLDDPFAMVVTGVGGTGVVTIGALIGMASHIEGKGCGIIDMAGLAQKGGSVMSHLRIAKRPEDIATIRVAAGGADLILGCDMVVAGGKKVLSAIDPGQTEVVLNTHEQLPGDFTRNADFSLPTQRLKRAITQRAGEGKVHMVDAHAIATRLFADSIMANIFMLGFAYQIGAIPVAGSSLEEAIHLNGQAVDRNIEAFRAGRLAAHDPKAFEAVMATPRDEAAGIRQLSETLDEMIARRAEFLTAYQNVGWAKRFTDRVAKVRAAEEAAAPGTTTLSEAVARGLFKVMSYKDEYEVARLYTDGNFARQLAKQFDGDLKLTYHLAPPLLARIDPSTGEPKKMQFGPWMRSAFGVLARFKGLRGTALDVFGYTEERRMERALIDEYETMVDEIASALTAGNHSSAVAAAGAVQAVRGFGHIKAENLAGARTAWTRAMDAFRTTPDTGLKAAE
ncbi:indolepyruvate ferredoxin oxidoreductase family protein [Tepidamorphus sp. 3E244]|uniref:indolepyruvate ferredoxin oxidoreductase family protein n=1 Tax=Tepidamorphus sp. 3E244 TaxID=3385498 RepID=UPI0038FC446B